MKIAVLGREGPLAKHTRDEARRRGHELPPMGAEAVIFFAGQPGWQFQLESVLLRGGVRRLVVRSHAYVYGAHAKNPGMMTEDRIPLPDPRTAGNFWLEAERCAARFPNWAAVRLTNVLAPEEGDLIVRQIAGRVAMPLAGRDPQVQFISLADAARALVTAAESNVVGIFNVAGAGSLPLKQAHRGAGTFRFPASKYTRLALESLHPRLYVLGLARSKHLKKWWEEAQYDHGRDQLEFNWTVSGERAARELGFQPEQSSVEALADFLLHKQGARPQRFKKSYDPWGLDEEYIRRWGLWFGFLRRVYWRIEFEGIENIPAKGRAIFAGNHRGFMPLDAVMHLSLVLKERRRLIRFLIIPCLLYFPFLSNFMTKLGGVIASQENAARLFEGENLVGIFPEGIRGTFLPYKQTYQLRDFSKSAFAQLAIEHQAPIIPVAVIGHAEIFPIIGRINSAYLRRITGWPYFPIAPPFPFLPFVPFPSKWHVRVLEAVPVTGLAPSDAQNEKLVRDLARYVQDLIQRNIDHMRARRTHIFWGKVLDGSSPPVARFEPARTAAGA